VTIAGCGEHGKSHKIAASSSTYPNPTVKNIIAKVLFPALGLILSVPALASLAQARPNLGFGLIADGSSKYMNRLDLTAEQKTKMQQLQASTRTQIEGVLTPEQRQKFQQIYNQRQANKSDRQALNLTTGQRTQLQAIRQANRTQFQALLTPAQQAQFRQGGMGGVTLTAEQQAKITQLRADSRTQMTAILTPAQQQQAKTLQNRRQAMRTDWQALNLTTEQKTQISAIRQASQQQFKAILTPEQQSKLKSGR
jgi:Spy/CpxP family protein refolding chaperone